MTVSMWNRTLDWNGLNKSESFMAVIIKVNPIQIVPFQGSQKKLKSFENGWKILKLRTSSIKFHWH